MKRLRHSNPALHANSQATLLRTLLFGFMATMLVTALPSLADPMPTVLDNIAPHPAPAQPLPFSHKAHLAIGLACQSCHNGPDPGIQMTFPATETCMSCHRAVAKDKSAIMVLQEFSVSGQQIPWVRVYAITPGVTWSHRTHLDAGVQCDTCHGEMQQIETVAETKAILAMASCISCHQATEASVECVSCHSWPTDKVLRLD